MPCASPTPAHVHAVVSLNKNEGKAVPRKTRLPKLHRSVHPSGSQTHREQTSTTDTSEYPVMDVLDCKILITCTPAASQQ